MSSRVIGDATPEQFGPALWRTIPAAPGKKPATLFGHHAANADSGAQLEEARQRGFAEGIAAARSQVDAEVAAVIQRLSAAIAGVVQLRHQVKEEAAEELVQLAIAIASRILHREVSIDPDAILGLVRAALQKAQSKEVHRIRMHPSHEVLLRRALSAMNPGGTIEITPDPSMKPGDVIFETAQGQLDASVSTQLREIERGLADRVQA